MADADPTVGRPGFVMPTRAVSDAELEADRWFLLQPPIRRFTRWWRTLAVFFLVLVVAGLITSEVFDVADPRTWWRWTILVLGTSINLVGVVWAWRSATLPRPIDTEIGRLTLAGTGERRRLARALRRGTPLEGTDRPAAAAYAASLNANRLPAGLGLAVAGAMLVFAADSATDALAWAAPTIWSVAALGWLAAAYYCRATQRAAVNAGVPPLVREPPTT